MCVQQLMGASVGDQRKFEITFPDDYPVELWQGMRAKVEISVREIFEWVLPEVSCFFCYAHFLVCPSPVWLPFLPSLTDTCYI